MRGQAPATIAAIATIDSAYIHGFYISKWEKVMKQILLVIAVLMIAGCDGSPESKAKLRAFGKASCAMSMHCDPSKYEATGNGWSNSNRSTSNGSRGGAITIGATQLCPLNSKFGNLYGDSRSGMNKICYYK